MTEETIRGLGRNSVSFFSLLRDYGSSVLVSFLVIRLPVFILDITVILVIARGVTRTSSSLSLSSLSSSGIILPQSSPLSLFGTWSNFKCRPKYSIR